MPNTYKNKVVYNGTTLIDLTEDTVTPSALAHGYTAHDRSGAPITGTASLQSKTVTPTESQQTVTADSGYYGLSSVSVGAISSTYVGSGIDQRSSTDLTASGATVTVPAGYYAEQASKAVASGTAGTPTATKGTVSNHAISVTPSVTNTTGYITGGTKTGTAVTVSASELVSGTLSITSSGTTDVTNYASASVAAGGATASATKGTVSNHSVTVTPSVTRTAGYVTAGSSSGTAVTVSASELVSGTYTVDSSGTKDVTNYASASVPSGSATASATKGSVSNHSVSVTPSVTRTAGWVSAGTASGTAVTVSASELVSGSETKTENGTYDVTNLASLIVDVDEPPASLRELICPQQTVTPSSYEVSLEREEGFVIGGHYVVTYDGTEYLFTAGSLWGGNGICLGEQTLNYDHSARNDEIAPFLLWETFNDVTRTPKLYAKDNNSHAIKVERIDGDSIETTNICPQQTVTTNSSYIGTLSNVTAQLVAGDYYLVTYDGTEWMLTAASLFSGDTVSVGDDAVRYDHAADDNIYPFWIYNDGAGMKFYALDANASHTVKIDRITEIPDSIALTTKSITSNGTYRAMDDGANGYSSVTVNVPTGSSDEFVVTMTLGQDDLYYPDCTYAEARQALSDNKTLVFFADSNVACSYDWDSSGITYFVDMLADAGYGDDVFRLEFRWTSSGVTFVGDEQFIIPSGSQSITTNNTYDVTRLSSVTVSVPTGGGSAQTATGTFTGNGTRTIDISSVTFEPDIVYFTCNPGTTASSGTVAAIIVRDMMTATRYRNNSTTNSHYAIPDIANLNTSGTSYSWRATYDSTNSKLTLYCYSNSARALLTNGRTYSYTFIKWT